MPAAGAGFRIVVAPPSRPSRSAVLVEPVGISWLTSTMSPVVGARRSSASATSVGESVALTPDATTISFSPWSSTRISATPVAPSETRRPLMSMPSRSSAARARRPNASRPTAPTNAVTAPSRAAATAWFAPLPPSCSENVPPVTVSPGTGSFAAWATRSTLTEPTTMTRPLMDGWIPASAGDEFRAVDADDVAAHPIGVALGEPDDRLGDVGRRRQPSVGVAGERHLDHPLVLGDLPQRWRVRDASPDRVHRDAVAAAGELHRE